MSKPIPKGTPVEGDMTAALDSRFLNSLVLQGAMEKQGKDFITVTIDRIEHHEVLQYENGKKDKNAHLLYFKGSDKPLLLKSTNIKRICMQHGAMGKDWIGKKIDLHTEMAHRPDIGTQGPCVRVKPNYTELAKARRAEMTGGEA